MTTQDIINYYSNLLNLQYLGKPKAYATIQAIVTPVVMPQGSNTALPSLPLAVQDAFNLNPTVQTLTFSAVPASGTFTVSYAGSTSTAISWSASLSAIQAAFSALLGVGQVTVSGSLADQTLAIVFDISQSPGLFSTTSSLLDGSSAPITIVLTTNQAVGVQLDILGKYVGVVRTGFGPTGPISLSDSDFLKLIQMAIISNFSGSSLSDIVGFLNQYFPGQIHVIDEANTAPMQMTYVIGSVYFSSGLLDLFISEGLLPRPMGVGIAVIAPPNPDLLFGYCDYSSATPTDAMTTNVVPYNCAGSYTLGDFNQGWYYLDYAYAIR